MPVPLLSPSIHRWKIAFRRQLSNNKMARARSLALALPLPLSFPFAGLLCGLGQSNSSENAACIEEAKQNIPETPSQRATKPSDPPQRPRRSPRRRLLSSCLRKCAVAAVYLRNLIKRITKAAGEPEPESGLNRQYPCSMSLLHLLRPGHMPKVNWLAPAKAAIPQASSWLNIN